MSAHDIETVANYEEFNMRGSLDNNSGVIIVKRGVMVRSPRITSLGYEILSKPDYSLIDEDDYETILSGLYFATMVPGCEVHFRGVECTVYRTQSFVIDYFSRGWIKVIVYNLTGNMLELPPYCVLGYLRFCYG